MVARGDLQSKGVDYLETFAPVVKLVSLRLLLTFAAIHDLDIVHWDVVAAFLTDDLTKEVLCINLLVSMMALAMSAALTNLYMGYANLPVSFSRNWTRAEDSGQVWLHEYSHYPHSIVRRFLEELRTCIALSIYLHKGGFPLYLCSFIEILLH